jgi:hypothetical protein
MYIAQKETVDFDERHRCQAKLPAGTPRRYDRPKSRRAAISTDLT